MFKDPRIKKLIPILIGVVIFICIVWFIFNKSAKLSVPSESSFKPSTEPDNMDSNNPSPADRNNDPDNLPGFFQLQYQISTKGKKAVFPFIIQKITDGPIELPNRRSLLDKDAKYKFIDIMPGQQIKVVSLQNLTYTVDHKVFTDDFLITENDYLIAYSQAKEHFKLVK